MTPQKAFFTKEKIIEAAFKVLRVKGWDKVTVRNIAKELDSSTMPIYSSGFSISEIEWELKAKVWEMIQEYQKKPYTPNPLSNLAVGLVIFAKDEPVLFRFLFLERPLPKSEQGFEDQKSQFALAYGKHKKLIQALRMVPEGIQDPLMLKTYIFTQGLASILASGQLHMSETKIITLLEEAGGAFYMFGQAMEKGGQHE